MQTCQTGEKFALAALDTLSIGIAILDGNASVLFMNKAGAEIIVDQGGLVLRSSCLTAEQADQANTLEHMDRRLASGGGQSGDSLASDPGRGAENHCPLPCPRLAANPIFR